MLTEAGLMYRSHFLEHDVESYHDFCVDSMSKYEGKKDKGWEKRGLKRCAELTQDFKAKQESYNRSLMAVVNQVKSKILPEHLEGFNKKVNLLMVLVPEILNSESPEQILTLVNLYNKGYLKGVFDRPVADSVTETEEKVNEQVDEDKGVSTDATFAPENTKNFGGIDHAG